VVQTVWRPSGGPVLSLVEGIAHVWSPSSYPTSIATLCLGISAAVMTSRANREVDRSGTLVPNAPTEGSPVINLTPSPANSVTEQREDVQRHVAPEPSASRTPGHLGSAHWGTHGPPLHLQAPEPPKLLPRGTTTAMHSVKKRNKSQKL
jgi:hypothetical protein